MAFNDAGDIGINIIGNNQDFLNAVDQAEKRLEKLAKLKALDKLAQSFTQLGKKLTTRVTLPVVAFSGLAVKSFADFDQKMTESLSIMTDVSESMRQQMADLAEELSGDSKFAARELAESYFFLASAGLDATQSMAALPAVTKFATAGAFDLARATDLLTDAQSALGLTSKDAEENLQNMIRVSDVLVKANTLANASVLQFSESLTNRAGAALRNLGKDVEEGVAVLAAFADQGRKGSEAGEALNIVLRDLQKAALENNEAFARANIAVFDQTGEMRNLADIIADLENRLNKMSDAQKKAELSLLGFQDRSQSNIITLLGTSQKIRDYEKALRSAGGTTGEVADKQMQSFSNQLTQIRNRIAIVVRSIGQDLAPTVLDLLDVVEKWLKRFSELDNSTKKIIISTVAFTAALGPALIVISSVARALIFLKVSAIAATIAINGLKIAIVFLVAKVGFEIGKQISIWGGWNEAIDETGQKINQFAERFRSNFRKNADFILANIRAANKLRGEIKGLEKGSKERLELELKLNKQIRLEQENRLKRVRALKALREISGGQRRATTPGELRVLQTIQKQKQIEADIKKQLAAIAVEEKKRRLEASKTLAIKKAEEQSLKIIKELELARLRAIDPFLAKQEEIQNRFEKRIEAIKKAQNAIGFTAQTQAQFKKAQDKANELRKAELEALEKERKQEIINFTANETTKTLIALEEEKKRLLNFSKTVKERERIENAFIKKQQETIKQGREQLRTTIEVDAPGRLNPILARSIEAFRLERGLDDETRRAQIDTERNTKATEILLRDLRDNGVKLQNVEVGAEL